MKTTALAEVISILEGFGILGFIIYLLFNDPFSSVLIKTILIISLIVLLILNIYLSAGMYDSFVENKHMKLWKIILTIVFVNIISGALLIVSEDLLDLNDKQLNSEVINSSY